MTIKSALQAARSRAGFLIYIAISGPMWLAAEGALVLFRYAERLAHKVAGRDISPTVLPNRFPFQPRG